MGNYHDHCRHTNVLVGQFMYGEGQQRYIRPSSDVSTFSTIIKHIKY